MSTSFRNIHPFAALALIVFAIAGSCPTFALSTEKPRLVIDSEGHSGKVRELLFSPDGKQLVSLSEDKTIRVWDSETGQLSHTIRTDIGDGDIGKHFAGALSPDGRWLAVGGWASGRDEDFGSIRIINLKTESVVAILQGHERIVDALAFSGNGELLVSGGADSSARVWEVSRWADAAATSSSKGSDAIKVDAFQVLQGHTRRVYAIDITEDGNTVFTGSFDNTLGIWKRSGSGKKFSRSALLNEHDSFVTALDASKDGNTLVSGDGEGKLIQWDGATGKVQKILIAPTNLMVNTISISPDEGKVFASTKTLLGGTTASYSLKTGREIKSFDHHDSSVIASAWHPAKPLIAAAGGSNHEIVLFLEATGDVVHQILGKGQPLWNVAIRSETDFQFAFSFLPPDPKTGSLFGVQHAFDLIGLQARKVMGKDDQFLGAMGSFGDQAISFDQNGSAVIGNMGVISPDEGSPDRFMVASFTEDGKSVLIGSNYYLRRYQRQGGKFVVKTEYKGHEDNVTMVAPTADGKYLISASHDQTARLWNLESGELLVTFMMARDGEWVCWTPEGYYTASPEGAKLIGWHFNRGIDKTADFVSGDQLNSHFFRPDIVRKTIEENRSSAGIVRGLGIEFDLESAVNTAPDVAISGLKDQSRSTQQRITFTVEGIDQGGGLSEVRAFHEGKRLQPDGPGSYRNGRLQVPFTVSLMSGKNQIRVVAITPEGVESPPKTTAISFAGTKATARLFLLAVGINEYKNPRLKLDYCRPDVDAFSESFRRRSGKLFAEISIEKLYDEDATAEAITAKMKQIAALATPDDVFVFVFAGHGVMSEGDERKDPEFHIVPFDVTQTYGNDAMLADKALSGSKLQQLSSLIPARKQLMVLDACQSGGVVDSFAIRGAQEERALAQLARASGMYVLASTRSEQYASEARELGHGLFTYALLEALDGKGDFNGDRKITVKEVEAWLNERVPELSEKHVGSAQYPNSFARGQDFPIGLVE